MNKTLIQVLFLREKIKETLLYRKLIKARPRITSKALFYEIDTGK